MRNGTAILLPLLAFTALTATAQEATVADMLDALRKSAERDASKRTSEATELGPFDGLPDSAINRIRDGVEQRMAELQPGETITTIAQFLEWYPPPSVEDNAAALYAQTRSWSEYDEGPDVEFAPLAAAAERERFLYPLNWEEAISGGRNGHDPAMELEILAKMRAHARFAQHECFQALEDGRIDDAVSAAIVGLRMVEHMGQQPTVLTQLTRSACGQIAIATVDKLLEDANLTGQQARAVAEACALAHDPDAVPRALIGERVVYGEPYEDNVVLTLADAELRVMLLTRELALTIGQMYEEASRWPASYDDLAPRYLSAAPINPFTGEPIPFEKNDGTYTFELQPEGSTAERPEDVVIHFAK